MHINQNKINPKELPIFKKGEEIYNAISKVCQVVETYSHDLGKIKDETLSKALLLSTQIEEAESAYNLEKNIECATIIRKEISLLPFRIHSIQALGFKHVEYFNVVMPLIEEYQVLFGEWVDGLNDLYNMDHWELLKGCEISLTGNEHSDEK